MSRRGADIWVDGTTFEGSGTQLDPFRINLANLLAQLVNGAAVAGDQRVVRQADGVVKTVTDAAAGTPVDQTLYNAGTLLYATVDDTPAAQTIAQFRSVMPTAHTLGGWVDGSGNTRLMFRQGIAGVYQGTGCSWPWDMVLRGFTLEGDATRTSGSCEIRPYVNGVAAPGVVLTHNAGARTSLTSAVTIPAGQLLTFHQTHIAYLPATHWEVFAHLERA